MPPLVHIVVLTWDGSRHTRQCLDSLTHQDYPNFRVVVVDNGSARPYPLDPTYRFPVSTLRLDRNRGFAGGVNAGITAALADGAAYVWLLNDDAEVAPDILTKLVAACQADPGIGLASPVIRNSDDEGRVAFHGGRVTPSTMTFDYTDSRETYQSWLRDSPHRIWLVGTALLIRRALVEKIGLFDEGFFAYWEDNDYSVRSIDAGFRNITVEDACVMHASGDPSVGGVERSPYYHYYMARNQLLLLRKHGGLMRNTSPTFWALLAQRAMAERLRGHPKSLSALRQGVWDGLRGIPGEYRPRRSPAAQLGQASLATAGALVALVSI